MVFGVGILLGAIVILAIRFVTYKPTADLHYHANFAVYIDGQRQLFQGPQYYQEVSICAVNVVTSPLQTAHMHNSVDDVVHVHHYASTWGQFFENLGWYVGDTFVETPDHMYTASGNEQLHVVLNGQDYTGLTPVTQLLIQDKDKLLVSFGDVSTATLQQEYKTIPSTAVQYDNGKDPASCSSGASNVTIGDRFKHLF